MYSPTTRLLTLLELLQSRGELSGQELAQILEVEERSIRRYITMLRDIGIPIVGERGRYGGYTLRPGFRLPPLMFNNEEIVAIMMGLIHSREIGTSRTSAIDGATAKIQRVLPQELNESVEALRSTLVFDEVKSGISAVTNVWINTFTFAAYHAKCLTITYLSKEGKKTERMIAPYGIVLHMQTWYVVAYCYIRKDNRIFRLDRVLSVSNSGEKFVKPLNFDVRNFVLDSLARMSNTFHFQIFLHIPISTAQEIIPPSLATLETAGKYTLMHCYADDPHWLARYLMRLELQFTVIATDELRDALQTLAEDIMDNLKREIPTHL